MKITRTSFDIGYYRIMVKVTAAVQKVFPFTAIQTVTSYNLTLAQAGKLILSIYVHLLLLLPVLNMNIVKCR